MSRSPAWARWLVATSTAALLAVTVPAGAHAQSGEPVPDPTAPAPTEPPTSTPEPTQPVPPAEVPSGDAPVDTTLVEGSEPSGNFVPVVPAPLDPTPHVRVLLAQFAVLDANDRVALAQLGLDDARARLAAAEQAVVRAEEELGAAEASLEDARVMLRDFSVSLFIHADGAVTPDATLDEFGVYQQRKTKQLTDSVRDHRLAMVEQAEERIATAERALGQRRDDVAAAAVVVAENEGHVYQAESELAGVQRELRVAQRLDRLAPYERDPDDAGETLEELDDGAPPGSARFVATEQQQGQWELPIQGQSVFTGDELAEWFATYQVVATRSNAPAADLARWFVEEGATEGLRGDVAFAQAILETGSFTNLDTIDHNNFAGIGHCDSCPSGWHFATPQLGVRAQIQLLKSYVFDRPEYVNPLVDGRLRGPAGCCQTWNELSGVWATAGGYTAYIMTIYEDMLEWLYTRRTGGPPPPRPG